MKGIRPRPLKTRVIIIYNKKNLTLGRFISSFKPLVKPYNKHTINKLYINKLEITPELLNKKLSLRLKNAYHNSIN